MYKSINIMYWKQKNLIPSLEHNQIFDYSIEKQNEIIQTILENNLSIMIRVINEELFIFIDKGRFTQS